jgi:hypothetical protein
MTPEHYALLGLARPRAGWFAEIGRWANSATLPAEFVRCVSAGELRARLEAGRAWSAVVIDHGVAGLERDLVEVARQAGCATIVVADGSRRRDWISLGAAAVLDEPIHPDSLLTVLREVAPSIGPLAGSGTDLVAPARPGSWQGALVAVVGAGGSGTSTVAMAVAQGLAADPLNGGRVVLVDAALDAAQAVLHDTGDVVPALQELVEAHRLDHLDASEVRALTFHCPDRGYDLLLGLRRHRDWTVLRPRAVDAAFRSLRSAYATVVADAEADVEGHQQTGSHDVEDRNLLARHLTSSADAVMVTGPATVVGLHRLVRSLDALLDHGVGPERLLPVVTRAPRSARGRAEVTRAAADLLGPAGQALTASPIFVPARKDLDGIQRDGVPLPRGLCEPLARAVDAVVERAGRRDTAATGTEVGVRVAPGSLGGGVL